MCFTATFVRHRLERCRKHHEELKTLQRKLQAALLLHDRQRTFVGGSEQKHDVMRLHTRLQAVTNTLCALESIIDTHETAQFLGKFRSTLRTLVQKSQATITETQRELPGLVEGLQMTQQEIGEMATTMAHVTDPAEGVSFDGISMESPVDSLLLHRDPVAIEKGESRNPQSPLRTLRRRRVEVT